MFNATILVLPISTRNKLVCEYSAALGQQEYFEFDMIFIFKLIKIV